MTRPDSFGALLDGVVSALANRADVAARTMDRPKHAADGLCNNHLRQRQDLASRRNPSNKHGCARPPTPMRTTLESSIITVPLLDFLQHRNFEWVRTMGNLLNLLGQLAGPTVTKQREWPDNPRALSAILADITPSLRAMYGIDHRILPRQGHDKHRIHSFGERSSAKNRPAPPAQDAAHAAHAACSLRRKLIATNPDLKVRAHQRAFAPTRNTRAPGKRTAKSSDLGWSRTMPF